MGYYFFDVRSTTYDVNSDINHILLTADGTVNVSMPNILSLHFNWDVEYGI